MTGRAAGKVLCRLRARARTTWFGLRTVLGLGRRGFFIPYRYARAVARAGQRPAYPAIEERFRRAEDGFGALLRQAERHAGALAAIGIAPPPEPRWDQDWFTGLDAIAAYVLIRERRPRALVEVGSGHSTRFFARAARDAGLALDMTCIDPAPRAALGGLGARLIEAPLQRAGDDVFPGLAAGDVVSVDSSHILMPGSDVDIVLNRILPMLPDGVLVHIHDIFLPDDYPAHWAWRGYNEQLGIAPLIVCGGWRIVWASHYVQTRMTAACRPALAGRPSPAKAHASSLWLEKAARRPDAER